MPAEEFADLIDAPLERRSLFSILEQGYRIELAYTDEEIDAKAADARTAELLTIPGGAPLVRIRQVIYTSKGKATAYMLGLYRSDRNTVLIRRVR